MPITVCRPGLLQMFEHWAAWRTIEKLNHLEASIEGLSYLDTHTWTTALVEHVRSKLAHLPKPDQRHAVRNEDAWLSSWIVDEKDPRDTAREEAGFDFGHYAVEYDGRSVGQLLLISVQKPSYGQLIMFLGVGRTASHPMGDGREYGIALRIAMAITDPGSNVVNGNYGFCVWQASGELATQQAIDLIENEFTKAGI